jgi:hypothetical protein
VAGMALLPDIELELPTGWQFRQRNQSPIGLGPESETGVLQISSPPIGRSWRGNHFDLESEIRRLAPGMKLGDVVSVVPCNSAYGRMVRAEIVGEDFGDVAMWLVAHETNDPLIVTWIADSPTDDGKHARGLAECIAPGVFSRGVDMIVSVARQGLATNGSLEYHAVFIGDGTVTTSYFHGMPDELEREAIRVDAKETRARVVARVGMANVNSRDGMVTCGFVHVESPTRKKRFLLHGNEVHETDTSGASITDFFLEPDPRAVEVLAQARTVVQ